jgi:hypothetical protein
MAVFGRRVELSIGQAGQAGVLLAGLRVSFRVRMDRGRSAHEAAVRVWNANPRTLAVLDAGPEPTVQLKVGYGDPLQPEGGTGLPRLIFLGELVRDGLRIEREGPERVAEIEAKDTPGAYQLGRVALTFATSVSMSQVVAAVVAELGLPVGDLTLVPDVTLAQGGTFAGAARDVLNRIAASVNADWWITDGVFFMTPKGQAAPGLVPVFSSLAGNLIGTPVKKDRGKIEVKALLDASMRPGLSFLVDSEEIKGTYVADSVEFIGDSGFDLPFYVQIVGRTPGS